MKARALPISQRARTVSPNDQTKSGTKISTPLLKVFARYSESYVRRHFHSVRLLNNRPPESCQGRPLLVYLNHSSWWDPLVCLLLTQKFFQTRRSYAPIEVAALRRYRFFERLGFFGVTSGSPRGGKEFLTSAGRILASEENALWITPQGKFADFHARPLKLQPGLSHLAKEGSRVAFVPLAIHYVHWEERLPEVLVAFGEPIIFQDNPLNLEESTRLFESRLTSLQDDLARASQRREKNDWQTLLHGKRGTSFVYDSWRRTRAWFGNERFSSAHSDL